MSSWRARVGPAIAAPIMPIFCLGGCDVMAARRARVGSIAEIKG